jgi:hypothetical protein
MLGTRPERKPLKDGRTDVGAAALSFSLARRIRRAWSEAAVEVVVCPGCSVPHLAWGSSAHRKPVDLVC